MGGCSLKALGVIVENVGLWSGILYNNSMFAFSSQHKYTVCAEIQQSNNVGYPSQPQTGVNTGLICLILLNTAQCTPSSKYMSDLLWSENELQDESSLHVFHVPK